MSVDAHAGHGDHGYGSGDDGSNGSLGSYLVGFGLSVFLTAIPFWLVMDGVLASKRAAALIIMAFAAVQVVVHMIFFLHMSPRSENGWTLMALLFTLVLVGITLSGSLWVMYHLNANMMLDPGMSQMP